MIRKRIEATGSIQKRVGAVANMNEENGRQTHKTNIQKRSIRLAFPMLMRQGISVEFIPMLPPLWDKHVHEVDKSVAVMTLNEVNHLMDDDIFEAMLWFSRELRVDANSAGARIAAPPLGLHLLHVKPVNHHAQYRCPSRKKGRYRRFDLFTIKLGNNGLLLIFTCSRAHSQEHLAGN
jgi:hypothetical protein